MIEQFLKFLKFLSDFFDTFILIFEKSGLAGPTKLKNVLLLVKTMNCENCKLFFVHWCYQLVIIENYLSPTHTEHYARRKQEQPLLQRC